MIHYFWNDALVYLYQSLATCLVQRIVLQSILFIVHTSLKRFWIKYAAATRGVSSSIHNNVAQWCPPCYVRVVQKNVKKLLSPPKYGGGQGDMPATSTSDRWAQYVSRSKIGRLSHEEAMTQPPTLPYRHPADPDDTLGLAGCSRGWVEADITI
jgi:hypothetical protein